MELIDAEPSTHGPTVVLHSCTSPSTQAADGVGSSRSVGDTRASRRSLASIRPLALARDRHSASSRPRASKFGVGGGGSLV